MPFPQKALSEFMFEQIGDIPVSHIQRQIVEDGAVHHTGAREESHGTQEQIGDAVPFQVQEDSTSHGADLGGGEAGV